MTKNIRAVVEALYASTGAGDWMTAETYLHDDFSVVEADSLPYAGRRHGKGALRALFEEVMDFWSDPSIEMHDITVGDDHAVGLLTLHATARATGQRVAMRIAEVFRFQDGRVIEIIPHYFDTDAIRRATMPATASAAE